MAVGSVAVLLFLVGLTSAFKIDMCQVKYPVMQNFDLFKMDGWWYEYARYPNVLQYLEKQKCNAHSLVPNGDRMELKFFYDKTDENGTETHVSMLGNATQTAERPGEVLIDLPGAGLDFNFSVLDAKYDDYAIIYFCDTWWYFKIELTWVLTRKQPDETKKASLIERLKELKIDTERLEFVHQENCGARIQF